MHLDENSKILDIGCGTGNHTLLIAEATNATVYGIDQSEGMLEKAKLKTKTPKVHYLKGDAATLEAINNNEFNVAFMVDVIHHIKDIKTLFKNIYRVLNDDGSVFIFTDSHERILNERLSSKYFPETIEVELKRYQPTEEIVDAMELAGFKNIETGRINLVVEINAGEKLIELAEKKGYSMFHFISQDAIEAGIARIKKDLSKGSIPYGISMPIIIARKNA